MSWTGTVTCGYCYNQGHNKRSCLKLKAHIAENPDSWQAVKAARNQASYVTRKCSYCQESGHNRRTCETLKSDVLRAKKVNKFWCVKLSDFMKEEGLGIGALVEFPGGWRNNCEPVLGMVIGFNWSAANFTGERNSYTGDFIRVRALKDGNDPHSDVHALRLPEKCWNLQEDTSSGRGRITGLLSGVASDQIEFPEDFIAGEIGVLDMFKDNSRNAGPIASVQTSERTSE